VDRLAATIDCGPDSLGSALETDLRLAVPYPPAEPPSAPVPEYVGKNLPNEPTAAVDDRPIAAEESTAALGDDTILTSEPSPGSTPVAGTDPVEESGCDGEAHACEEGGEGGAGPDLILGIGGPQGDDAGAEPEPFGRAADPCPPVSPLASP
jgi:hypothetical protein